MTDDLQQLRRAVDGLFYPSESDRPFEVLTFPLGTTVTSTNQLIQKIAGRRKIIEQSVDAFFDALKGSEDADRLVELQVVASRLLRGLKVYRVGTGEPSVDVYLIGRTRSGAWAGLHTVSIET